MDRDIHNHLSKALSIMEKSEVALRKLGEEMGFDLLQSERKDIHSPSKEFELNDDSKIIYEGLLKVSPKLADSYMQVKKDLNDSNRISWAGTAHEIRQIVATLLDLLAPDDLVKEQPKYKQDPNTSGPTQKQKVVYILRQRDAGSKVQEVVEKVAKLDDAIGEIVRGFYSRASVAAHTTKDKRETRNLLKYFEAFAHDLLDLE